MSRLRTVAAKRRTRVRAAAHSAALRRIAVQHPDEFAVAYALELSARGLVDHPRLVGVRSPGTDGEAPLPPASTKPAGRDNPAATASRGPQTNRGTP